MLNPKKFVFVDESFCKTGMRREHGWSIRGERVVGSRPGRHWNSLSLVGAIRLGERPRLMTHRGAVNGRTFLRFVKLRLAPWLKRGDVVVLDNLNIHKMRVVRAAIERVGAFPIYLPTYSPELNPIELWWADMKRELRRIGADTAASLGAAVRRLRWKTPPSKIGAWFRFSWKHAQLN
jgi:transposase